MSVRLTFEQWPGTIGPLTRTPDRRAGSVRRTTSIHSTWPEGFEGDFAVDAWGRDLVTTDDGTGVVSDSVTLHGRAEGPEKTVRSLSAQPPRPGLEALIGSRLSGGFRRAVGTTVAPPVGSVLALLLDDVPAAAVVSGAARLRALIELTGDLPGFSDAPLAPICAGRQLDGVAEQRRRQGLPLIGQGPPAGDLSRPDDPLAWPAEAELPVHGMRRIRRIDVSVAGDLIVADTYFRDTYRESSGVETTVHEYEIGLTAGTEDLVVRTIDIRPRVLPNPDCPTATASAQAVVGQPLAEMRSFVRTELGDHAAICTHLNDQLRSLADIPTLFTTLRDARSD